MREILARVKFRGVIRDRSVEPFVRLLNGLRERPRVRGVLFDVSSGGGEAVAATDLFLAVKRLDQAKPVVAAIGSMAASGGYMAALGARQIYAYPDSAVGSIGVILPHFALEELLRRLGISVELLHVGRHKDAYQGLRPLTEEERGKMLALAQEGYDRFVGLVARERRRPLETIRELATGEVWTGARAKTLGLVDELGDREEALHALARLAGVAPRRTVEFSPPRPFLERIFSTGLSVAGEQLTLGVRGAIEDAVVEATLGYR